ncbi:MAG TPA: VOC family protein [Acidimicrobiales bacterium]
MPTAKTPILHLSLPVRDLGEARDFYVDALGCRATRARDGFVDVWFYGMQLTLHDRPDETRPPGSRGCRHFGVTLARDEFDAVVARLDACGARWVDRVSTDHEGSALEQTKAKIADPSGNVVEIKTYPDVASALEMPVTQGTRET